MNTPKSDFETILKKVSFELKEDSTIVEVDYQIIENNAIHKENYTKSRAFPLERDVVSIIDNELKTLDFIHWRGIRRGKKT